MNDLVSIIVPVYNIARYLPRCLKSLTEQTYRSIEIILVDDGSTDDSGRICDQWADRDSRIRVFHKENAGPSDARNFGLQKAAGAYISFVDSDDWCDSSYIEVLLRTLLETDCDIVECDYVCTEADTPVPQSGPAAPGYEIYTGRDCFRQILTEVCFVAVWNKLYRRSIIGDEQFQFGMYHEDEDWTYRVFSRARKLCRLHYTGYYYFQREGSIVHSRPTYKRLNDAFRAGKDRIAFVEQHYPEFASITYSKMLYTCMNLHRQTRDIDPAQRDLLQRELVSYARDIFRKYLKNRQYRKEMWRFCFFSLFPNGYSSLNP